MRFLITLNNASNLKFCWGLLKSQNSSALLLKHRVLRNKRTKKHHIFSSLWSNIKEEYLVILENSIWVLGDGSDINF